jgi:GNAT superfamily N-acetyltransferase
MINFNIREGTIEDLSFLKQMLYEAIFWHPKAERAPMDEIFSVPEIKNIISGWMEQDGDFALIAENEKNESLAAVWYRFWTKENSSFGFIDESTPELGIAVLSEYRNLGLGRMLLTRILQHIKNNGLKQVSLSVDPKNHAKSLYNKFGFIKVGESGTSWTMLKKF